MESGRGDAGVAAAAGAALRTGTAARVPLLIGSTRHEMRAFASKLAGLAEQYRSMMTETFGDQAGAVLAAYPVVDSPALTLTTAVTDWGGAIGACPALRTAEAAAARQPVHLYEFAEDSGQVTEAGFPMGAYHGVDLPYLWNLHPAWPNPYPDLTGVQERLSATMIDYWSTFARTGNPNGPHRPHWPEFGETGTVPGLSTSAIAPTEFATAHRCDFWAGLPR